MKHIEHGTDDTKKSSQPEKQQLLLGDGGQKDRLLLPPGKEEKQNENGNSSLKEKTDTSDNSKSTPENNANNEKQNPEIQPLILGEKDRGNRFTPSAGNEPLSLRDPDKQKRENTDRDTNQNGLEQKKNEDGKNKGFEKNANDCLAPDERAYVDSLYDKGELQPTIKSSTDVPKEPRQHLPTEKMGHFSGERGNSLFYPNSEDAQAKIADYGRDSVEYKNGSPDFKPFSTHDSPWGKVDTCVEIPHMTDQRENPSWEYGRRPEGTSHDPNYDLGNFAQADNALRDKINTSNPDHPVTSDDIEAWRKNNGLTWHELDDGKSMMLVPTVIHDACPHSGGVAEMRTNMAYGNYEPEQDDATKAESKAQNPTGKNNLLLGDGGKENSLALPSGKDPLLLSDSGKEKSLALPLGKEPLLLSDGSKEKPCALPSGKEPLLLSDGGNNNLSKTNIEQEPKTDNLPNRDNEKSNFWSSGIAPLLAGALATAGLSLSGATEPKEKAPVPFTPTSYIDQIPASYMISPDITKPTLITPSDVIELAKQNPEIHDILCGATEDALNDLYRQQFPDDPSQLPDNWDDALEAFVKALRSVKGDEEGPDLSAGKTEYAINGEPPIHQQRIDDAKRNGFDIMDANLYQAADQAGLFDIKNPIKEMEVPSNEEEN